MTDTEPHLQKSPEQIWFKRYVQLYLLSCIPWAVNAFVEGHTASALLLTLQIAMCGSAVVCCGIAFQKGWRP